MKDFFDVQNGNYIHIIPKHSDETAPINKYSDDWELVSKLCRQRKSWICEGCNGNFINNKQQLHVHHIDGIKFNNNISNLKVLCIDCHKKLHPHLRLL